MYPKITHLPFKTINLLIGTEYLLGNDRNFLDVILKEDNKYGNYCYSDTEKFEESLLSFTDEQKKDLLAGMRMFNEEIIDLQFNTYCDQCKKDQQKAWSSKPGAKYYDFIAVEKDATYEHKELRYLDLMRHNNLSQWFEKIINIILGKIVVFRDFQSNLWNQKVANLWKILDCFGYLTSKYNSTIYLLTEDSEHSYLVDNFCSYYETKSTVEIGTCQKFDWNEDDTEIEVFNCLQ